MVWLVRMVVRSFSVNYYELKFWVIFMPIIILAKMEADSRVEEEKNK